MLTAYYQEHIKIHWQSKPNWSSSTVQQSYKESNMAAIAAELQLKKWAIDLCVINDRFYNSSTTVFTQWWRVNGLHFNTA